MTEQRSIHLGKSLEVGKTVAIDADFIVFMAPDGRPMFEVRAMDSDAIEIRGVGTYKTGGEESTLMSQSLTVEPRACNSVIIRSKKYGV